MPTGDLTDRLQFAFRVRSRFRPANHSIVSRQYHCACALKYPVLGNSRRAGALGMISAFPFLTQCGGLAQIRASNDIGLIACPCRPRSEFSPSTADSIQVDRKSVV